MLKHYGATHHVKPHDVTTDYVLMFHQRDADLSVSCSINTFIFHCQQVSASANCNFFFFFFELAVLILQS